MDASCSIIYPRDFCPILWTEHIICRWGSSCVIVGHNVWSPLSKTKSSNGKSLRPTQVKVYCTTKVLQWGADLWGPLWLNLTVQDKVLQQGADHWDPSWSKSAVPDKFLKQGADHWDPSWSKSIARDKVLQQGAVTWGPSMIKVRCMWQSPPTRGRIKWGQRTNSIDFVCPPLHNFWTVLRSKDQYHWFCLLSTPQLLDSIKLNNFSAHNPKTKESILPFTATYLSHLPITLIPFLSIWTPLVHPFKPTTCSPLSIILITFWEATPQEL